MPHAVIDGVPVSQSLAIVRVLARKAGIEGKTDADFAKSEMLIEECNDIFSAMGKAMYPPSGVEGRPAAFAEFFGAGGACAKHLASLEKLLANGRFTTTTTTGELAVVAIICCIKELKPTSEFLAATPGIAAFFAAREEAANAALANLGVYFKTTA